MAKIPLGVASPPARYRNFAWKEHSDIPIPASVAAQRIDQLKARHRGRVRPEHLVNDARPAGSVFHPCFEWNNRLAAEAHRRQRAMEILRSLCVIRLPANPQPIRYLYNVTMRPRQPGRRAVTSYVDIHRASRTPAYRQEVLEDALVDLKAFATRYAGFSRVAGMSLLIAGVTALIAQAQRLPVTRKRNR